MSEIWTNPFNDPSWDDQSLSVVMLRAREGDRAALELLLERVQKYLGFLAQQHGDPSVQAKWGTSDIVQKSMIRAVQNLDDFRGDTLDEFRGWLRKILINETRQLQREYRAQKRNLTFERRLADSRDSGTSQDLVDPRATPGSEAILREQRAVVQQMLDQMPETERQVIQWRNWDNLTFEEIARRLGTSVSSASRIWYRALVNLQKQLDEKSQRNDRI